MADSFYFFGRQQVINMRYHDIISLGPVDNRTGDEIVIDIVTRLNLKVTQ